MEPVTPSTIVFPPPRIRTTLRGAGFSTRRSEFFFIEDRQLILDQAPAQISLGIHDVSKFLQIFFGRSTDNGVAVRAPSLHLARRGFQARFNLLGGFSSALRQPAP